MSGSRCRCDTLENCGMNWVSKATARLVIREQRSAPSLARIDDCFLYHRAPASAKSSLGEALAYITKYRDGLGIFLTDDRVKIDNNTPSR